MGQRRGVGVSTGERSYVLEVDPRANRVVVGPGEMLARRGFEGDRVTWVAGEPPGGALKVEVQIRYRGSAVPAMLLASSERGSARVEFDAPQRAVAPGQSAVFYRGDEVLGGARIKRAFP